MYCFARPTHEFFGFSSGIDFESRIVVKENAPELLRKELAKRSYRPEPIALSPNTDCYQTIERKLNLTRRCLEVFAECRNPVGIVTKNAIVMRDLDLLCDLASVRCGERVHLRNDARPGATATPRAAYVAAGRPIAGDP